MTSKIRFGFVIDELRKKDNLTLEEFGKKFGKTKSTVSRWISGERSPKISEIEKIADYYNLDIEEIVFGTRNTYEENLLTSFNQLTDNRKEKVINFTDLQLQEQTTKVNESKVVYITSKLSAGTGIIDLDPQHLEEKTYDKYIPKHDLAFEVSGDSMTPLFEDGEIVFVEKTPVIRSGQVIAVQINEEAYIKKAYIEDNKLRLVSLNKNYKDIIADEADDIRVIGKVIL